MVELVDVIDDVDRVIAQKPLEECLRLGILHRAVSVFLWNSRNQIYVQRRSLHDELFPGYWTASCTGHVSAGEDYFEAAVRELREELGINSERPRFVLKFIVPPIRFGALREHEMMYVLESRAGDQELRLDPVEVEEGAFLSVPRLKRFIIENRDSITPDALLSFDKYFKAKGI